MRREKAPDKFSQCRKCGARIIFVRMKSGKSMPVNPNFVNFRRDGGKDRIVLANGEVTSGTIVTDVGIKAAVSTGVVSIYDRKRDYGIAVPITELAAILNEALRVGMTKKGE